jgi:hypothetical protein
MPIARSTNTVAIAGVVPRSNASRVTAPRTTSPPMPPGKNVL